MAVSVPLTGGCAYECAAEPLFMWKCHCRECQRSTGGGSAVNVVFSASSVRFTKGAPKEHVSTGTSGNQTYRGFCPECGSPISARADLISAIRGISAASLDDPSQLELVADIWTASAQPWDELSATLPQFATTPTEAELQELASH
ncbi:MAG: GFA family protein [Desulfurellaceae bacterium]|nr:GFA family protein [Desulfurellaceae bacterium]